MHANLGLFFNYLSPPDQCSGSSSSDFNSAFVLIVDPLEIVQQYTNQVRYTAQKQHSCMEILGLMNNYECDSLKSSCKVYFNSRNLL